MKLAGRIPVEPLDDERLTNIERRVVAGAVDAAAHHALRAPRRVAGRVLTVAVIAAAGVVGWSLHGAPPRAPVAEPAAVRVEHDRERAVLDIEDARITSDPSTVFTVTRPDGGVVIAMTRGKLALEVDKRGPRPPLVVRAGETDVVVVGTQFTVDYGGGSGEVDVRVSEGSVRVIHQQQETRVAAGQGWRTRSGLVASITPIKEAASPDGAAITASAASPPPGVPGVPVVPVTAGSQAATDAASASSVAVASDHQAAVPDGPVGPIGSPADATRRPTAGSEVVRRPARIENGRSRVATPSAPPSDPITDLRAAIRAQPVYPALAIGNLGADVALQAYSDIAAHQSGDEASHAFYSVAVVDHLRLGRNSDALHWLDAYVRRFPGGKEYRAALWLRVRILCLAKIDDRCRAAAYTYLHEAPTEPAARVAERLTLTE
jgi:FecR protein